MKIAGALAWFVAACAGSPTPHPAAPPEAVPSAAAPPPAAPDVAITVDGDVTDAHVAGIHVLIKRIPGAEAASTGLYVLGGAATWTKETAGLEQLALAVATTGGTRRLDKDAFAKRLADLGSTLDSGAERDYSAITAWSLTPAWDDTFALLAETFREPALPAAQLEIERRRQVVQLQHELDNPDGRLNLLAEAGMFKDHPYASRPRGTPETVGGFTGEQVAAQLASLRQTSRMLFVVVGDLDAKHVVDAVQRAFGDLPNGGYEAAPVPELGVATAGRVEIVTDTLPTNYIEAVVAGPRWRDPDFAVARVAMQWLGELEFEEVRTKRNLSYSPGAGLRSRTSASLAWLYVTAVDPKTTMKVMLETAKRMRDAKISEHDLASSKAMLLTATYMGSEAPKDQAALLAHAQIYGGDWHFARTLPNLVDAVTADQVQGWCAEHLTHLQTFVVGDGTKLDRELLESF